MRDRLTDALKKATADYAEIRVETEESTTLAYRGAEMERAGSLTFRGGIARACTKGGWGVVAFDSLDDLGEQVAEACRCAALVGKEATELAEVEPVVDERPAVLERDFRGVGLDEKIELIRGYNEIVLGADPSIESSSVGYSDAFRTVYFANTRGTYFMEERPRVLCAFSATGRNGALVQRAHDSRASATTYAAVLGLEESVLEVARRAAALLKAPKVEGGAHTVILDPALGGVFIHEAFGHLSEADFLYENPKMRDLMVVGRAMGSKDLNVVDDGTIDRTIGSLSYDDEGTPAGKTYLIRGGVLAGHLHSLETAGKMRAKPTGNARAIRREYPPVVRMTNTYIENGRATRRQLIGEVDRGVYACDMYGGQTEFEQFTFSAAYGYRIENGQVGELVRDIVLTGNVFETLEAIDGVADDLTLRQRGGGCGKAGQMPLPITCASPHIRIQNVVIGG